MIACHCQMVSDRTMRDLADRGCGVDEIGEACNAGLDCGGCLPTIEAIVAESRARSVPA